MRGSRSSDATVQARREQILEDVLQLGSLHIGDLATRHHVSQMTVHRDLDVLSAAGLLRKERGRAVAPSALLVETSALFRLRAGQRLKEAVARAAAPDLDGVRRLLVDDSTSVLPLLRALGERAGAPITLLTNYLEAVRQASGYARFRVHVLGGDYVPHLDAAFGPETVKAVRRRRVDAAVFSVPAVEDGLCYHALPDSAELKHAALDVADSSVLLLDHTKTPRTGPHPMFDVGRFDTVVVDGDTDAAQIAAMRSTGARVLTVATPQPIAEENR